MTKTELNNLKNVLERVHELDTDIQVTLFATNERETEELHYALMNIADRIEAHVEQQGGSPVTA